MLGGKGDAKDKTRLTRVRCRLAAVDVRNSFCVRNHVPQPVARNDEPSVVGRKSNLMEKRLRCDGVWRANGLE
jgi:hypothetical protein